MMNSEKTETKILHSLPMEVDPAYGLTAEQVKQREGEGLVNKVAKHPTKTYAQIILDNVFNYINIVLLFVFVIMMIAKLEISHYFFMFILGANTAIGLFQDIRARRLIDRLKVVSDPKGRVIREGKKVEIPAAEIVLSDIVVFEAGDQIVCDAVVREGHCSVDESLLTGESRPVKKGPGDTLLSGTYIVKGTVRAEVAKVGNANYAETLQGSASVFVQPKSEIRRSVGAFIAVTGTFALVTGIAMYVSYGLYSGDWLGFFTNKEMVKSVSGSMVAMLPTGMFLLTSTSLAVGVIALGKKKMLVQQLYCIEMLARVNAICFDKTGTLTDGKMVVVGTLPLPRHSEEEVSTAIKNVLGATQDNNATANALADSFGREVTGQIQGAFPFDSSVKFSMATVNGVTYGFGAYGFLPVPKSKELDRLISRYTSEGNRVLVVGQIKRAMRNNNPVSSLSALGIVVLADHIKEDAADNIAWFQSNDVTVRIISGDDPATVASIAKRVGVRGADRYVSLEGKSLEECAKLIDEYAVFGRVTPEQKAALVSALQERGDKVAMTGDGVNDILALKVADCSIAMASGADAAKSVAHLVALNNDFSQLPEVVKQGRRVINNLQRTCSLFLNKTFFAVTLSILFFILQTTKGPEYAYPFVVQNLFVWESFLIAFPAFFLALQPSNERLKGSFLKNIVSRAVPAGIAESFAALIPLFVCITIPKTFTYLTDPADIYELAKTMAVLSFTLLSAITLFRVCLPFNRYRAIVFSISVGGAILAFIGDFFHLFEYVYFNFGVSYSGMTWGFPIVVLISSAVSTGLYILLDYLGVVLEARTGKRKTKHEITSW